MTNAEKQSRRLVDELGACNGSVDRCVAVVDESQRVEIRRARTERKPGVGETVQAGNGRIAFEKVESPGRATGNDESYHRRGPGMAPQQPVIVKDEEVATEIGGSFKKVEPKVVAGRAELAGSAQCAVVIIVEIENHGNPEERRQPAHLFERKNAKVVGLARVAARDVLKSANQILGSGAKALQSRKVELVVDQSHLTTVGVVERKSNIVVVVVVVVVSVPSPSVSTHGLGQSLEKGLGERKSSAVGEVLHRARRDLTGGGGTYL